MEQSLTGNEVQDLNLEFTRDKIRNTAITDHKRSARTQVELRLGSTYKDSDSIKHDISELAREFSSMTIANQAALFKQLLSLHRAVYQEQDRGFIDINDMPEMQRLVSILGKDAAERFVTTRISLFTLTGNGHQLRCWSEIPYGAIGNKHVDSFGDFLVMSFEGDTAAIEVLTKVVEEYYKPQNKLMHPESIVLSNGAKIFGIKTSWDY